jgi:hypothetical protein
MIPVVDLSSDKEDLFPTPHGMRILPRGTSVTSTVVFLGCLVMAASSSSVTLTKKRRHVKRMPPTPMLRHLLL